MDLSVMANALIDNKIFFSKMKQAAKTEEIIARIACVSSYPAALEIDKHCKSKCFFTPLNNFERYCELMDHYYYKLVAGEKWPEIKD